MLQKFLILIACLFLSVNLAHAQTMTDNNLAGKWYVRTAAISNLELSEEQKLLMNFLQQAMLKSSFEFKKDYNFSFNIEMGDMSMTNVHWKLNPKTQVVSIQEWKDKNEEKSLLMEIQIQQKDGKVFFKLADEINFILEVYKK